VNWYSFSGLGFGSRLSPRVTAAVALFALLVGTAGCEYFLGALLQRAPRLAGAPLVYGPATGVGLVPSDDSIAASSSWQLSFDIGAGWLETYHAEAIWPNDFVFNGFLAVGSVGSVVGSHGFDFDFDGVADYSVSVVSIDDNNDWVDALPNGIQDANEPTVSVGPYPPPRLPGEPADQAGADARKHSSRFAIYTTLPLGGDGDASTITGFGPMRIVSTIGAGLITNPATSGDYSVSASFWSVDPDTDGPDDGLGDSPIYLPGGTTILISGPMCGDTDGSGDVTASDALRALQAAVGVGSCALDFCDVVNADGDVTASDALAILQRAVGIPVAIACLADGSLTGCQASLVPTCGGVCRAGEVCASDFFDPSRCECVPGCELETSPACGVGDCAVYPGTTCQQLTLAVPALGQQAELCDCIEPGLQVCGDSAGSGCDGACSPGRLCGDDGQGGCSCTALPVQGDCAQATAPACGGTCAPGGNVCEDNGSGSCACVSATGNDSCEEQAWPSCGGSCESGRLCAAGILGDCECVNPCELGEAPACGGSCLQAGDECMEMTGTVGGVTLTFCNCLGLGPAP